jgi:hypothetical protein
LKGPAKLFVLIPCATASPLSLEERRMRRVSKDESPFSLMVRDGARAPPRHEDIGLLWLTCGSSRRKSIVLTKTPISTIVSSFRGHLSRPACSHVKQFAKQAGDSSDPGRTYCSGRVFYGLFSGGSREPAEEAVPKW